VLAVHRHQPHTALRNGPHHQLARDNKSLLVGERNILPGFNCAECGLQPGETDEGTDHKIYIRTRNGVQKAVLPAQYLRTPVHARSQEIGVPSFRDNDPARAEQRHLLCEQVDVAVSGQIGDAESLRVCCNDLETAAPDGAGRTEDRDVGDTFHGHMQYIKVTKRCLYIKPRDGTFLDTTMRWMTFILLLVLCAQGLRSQTPDVHAKFQLAQGFEQAGEWERAAGLYKELLAREPSNYIYFDGLHRMYMQLKKYDDAVRLIQDLLTRLPADFTLYGMLGTAHYRAGRETQAQETWELAIALHPANQQSYRVIASVLIENRLLERAAAMYRRGRIGCNDPYLFTIELSQLLAASMDYAGATEEYLRWLQQNPSQIGFVQGRMAAFSYKDDGRAAAIATVRKALETRQDLRLYELLGWLYLEGKEYGNAFDVYRHIDDLTKANGGAVLGFADRVFRERGYDVAARAYREALRLPLQPAHIPRAKYGYACALLESQTTADSGLSVILSTTRPVSETRTRYEGAVASFNTLVEEYPRSEYSAKSLYQIGMVQLRQYGDMDAALRCFEQVLQEPAITPTGRYDVQLRIGEILVARADTVRAAATFGAVTRAADATPDQDDEAQYHLAELAFFNGRIDDAVRLLGTISLNVQHDYTNDALQLQAFLQENVAAAPEALRAFGRAEYLARQHKNTEAAALLEDIVQRFPAAGVADDALLRTGALLTAAGRYADAVSVYERLLSGFRDNSNQIDRALFRLGEVRQFGLHDTAQAILAYERLLAEQPQSILVHEARKRIRILRGETL